MKSRCLARLVAISCILLSITPVAQGKETSGPWIQLFNGKNLDGWTLKIKGFEVGDNHNETFRVEDGAIKAVYDQYQGRFRGRFGHLFYNETFSNYDLRVE